MVKMFRLAKQSEQMQLNMLKTIPFLCDDIKELKVENLPLVIKLPIGDFEFGVCVFRIGDWGVRIEDWGKMIWAKHQSPIQNHQLCISSPIGDFHF